MMTICASVNVILGFSFRQKLLLGVLECRKKKSCVDGRRLNEEIVQIKIANNTHRILRVTQDVIIFYQQFYLLTISGGSCLFQRRKNVVIVWLNSLRVQRCLIGNHIS